MRATLLVLTIIALIAVPGCKPKEEAVKPQGAAEPPPEPTQPELEAELAGAVLNPLRGPLGSPPQPLNRVIIPELVNKAGTIMGTHQSAGHIHWKAAKESSISKLNTTIRELRDKEKYLAVTAGIQIYRKLNGPPAGGEDKYTRLLKQAELILAQPRVAVTGFMEIDGELTTYVTVTEKTSPKTKTQYELRESEEFHSVTVNGETVNEAIRLVQIIGDKSRVEFFYKPAQRTFFVDGPSSRQ